MSQRISDEYLAERIEGQDRVKSEQCKVELDLRDARAEIVTLKDRIAELERLSASQEEAHAARDRGASL